MLQGAFAKFARAAKVSRTRTDAKMGFGEEDVTKRGEDAQTVILPTHLFIRVDRYFLDGLNKLRNYTSSCI